MTVADRVRDVVLPLLAERDLELYDVEVAGRDLRVVVDRAAGLDLDRLAEATRAVSRALDDADPIAGAYTLEVSSPGLERRLRTPQHFAGAVGEAVKVGDKFGLRITSMIMPEERFWTVRAKRGLERSVGRKGDGMRAMKSRL